jgi:hypothetical protein
MDILFSRRDDSEVQRVRNSPRDMCAEISIQLLCDNTLAAIFRYPLEGELAAAVALDADDRLLAVHDAQRPEPITVRLRRRLHGVLTCADDAA